ncbi:Programmed cell death protein 6 [Coelomomyces lativittatus]|nr:Programmed cell death protein 6 [Coelomomyces lativittatus]KAJ1508290.1 Programmed cell death protein 6 [Coelomomyces lativittatus]KAJ1511661.1 Programmed cell death protein 6 [Coelomomyces lativittatus]
MSYPQGRQENYDPKLEQWFSSADVNRQRSLNAEQLQRLLATNAALNFNNETIHLMINMFDADRSGTIQFPEFTHLWKYICEWRERFEIFDRDRSGTIDARELEQAFIAFGYRLTPPVIMAFMRKYDFARRGVIAFDSFIQCCVSVRILTAGFQRVDTDRDGWANIDFCTFLELAFSGI